MTTEESVELPVYGTQFNFFTGYPVGYGIVGKVEINQLIVVDEGHQIFRTKNGTIIGRKNIRSWLGKLFLKPKYRYVRLMINELNIDQRALAKCVDKVL